jgi:RNA polymerase sigma factor (TIGR02999 family)
MRISDKKSADSKKKTRGTFGQIPETPSLNNFDDTFRALYPDLRKLAHRLKQGDGSWTISPTALLHEAYLHLRDYQGKSFESRDHLRNAIVLVMRRLLVDAARRRVADRRGGGTPPLGLDAAMLAPAQSTSIGPEQLLDIHRALENLDQDKEKALQARVFEYHFFAGLSQEEIAAFLRISPKAVRSNLRLAKARLAVLLAQGGAAGAGGP